MTDSITPPVGGHTPGPAWSFRYFMNPVGKNDDNFHLFGGPEGDQGSTILEGAFTFPGSHSEALVYARLIAAAPELLSSLVELLEPLERASALLVAAGKAADENAEAAFDRARAAISKATGVHPHE